MNRASGEPLAKQVFLHLADGDRHSGEQLARRLGVTRTSIWKAVRVLGEMGLRVSAATNRGYQTESAIAPLDATTIIAMIPEEHRARVRSGTVVWFVPSTNAVLMAKGGIGQGCTDFLLAEFQDAGRGRRARRWIAPLGGGLCLSLSWTFPVLPADIGALSLAIGLAIRGALEKCGVPGVSLKWPNDLMIAERKLGGILIEMRSEASGPAYVVVGVGINCDIGSAAMESIRTTGTDPIDLRSVGCSRPDRNSLAAAVIGETLDALQLFERAGFAPFTAQWRQFDLLHRRQVTVAGDGDRWGGVAAGVANDGALLVQTESGVRRLLSGEVSVRTAT